jgi:hypothetical protein
MKTGRSQRDRPCSNKEACAPLKGFRCLKTEPIRADGGYVVPI